MNNLKIFITGISATGKTWLAKLISKNFNINYFDFDANWDFNHTDLKYENEFFDKLPNGFVIDSIPYLSRYNIFREYREKNESTLVVCVFQSNIQQWMKNIIMKDFYRMEKEDNLGGFIPNPIFHTNFPDAWMYFYTIEAERIRPTFYYDSSLNRILSHSEFMDIREEMVEKWLSIKSKNQHFFKDYLDTFDIKLYDKYYQDIECINFVGYSKSHKTWENIKDLVDWKDKIIVDMGCYHGYFSFKAEKMGAKEVTGLEKWESVMDTAMLIKHMIRSKVNFQIWEGGEPTPNADITLVLNMLHHTKDQEKTLQNINTKLAIFEVEKTQVNLIKKYFKILKEVESHRVDPGQNRTILLGEKI